MNYIDIFIVVILGLALIKGYFRGLLLTTASISAYVAGIGVALYYYIPFSKWLDQSFDMADKLSARIYTLLPIPEPVMNLSMNQVHFDELTTIVNELPLPTIYQGQILEHLGNYQLLNLGANGTSIGYMISYSLANTLIEIVAFGMLLFGVILLVRRLAKMLTLPISRSPLGIVNRVGGAGMGLVIGALGLVLLLGLAVPVITLSELAFAGPDEGIAYQVNESALLPFFLEGFNFLQASIGGIVPFHIGVGSGSIERI